MDLQRRAQRIHAVILDVDGVLTDGRIGYGGGMAIAFFNIKDLHGLKLLRRAGFRVGLLSGRACEAHRMYAAEVPLDFVYEGEKDKRGALEKLLTEQGLAPEECLAMGDDVVDIPVLRRVGIGVAVADAVAEVRANASWVTRERGGHGAVRETVEWLLRLQGQWQELIKRYLE